jgi:outer membrane protein OmpA-like peptidoglycan-associated protein
MKFLLIGFLSFLAWSAFSTHIWVCSVKGLCYEKMTTQADKQSLRNEEEADSIKIFPMASSNLTPGDLMIYFEFDKSDFISDSMTDRYFTRSKTYFDNNSGTMLSITGYTDSIGTDSYNQALGLRRARTIKNYFIKSGMQTDKIVIGSNGEKYPAGDNNTASGRATNRRTVITIKN